VRHAEKLLIAMVALALAGCSASGLTWSGGDAGPDSGVARDGGPAADAGPDGGLDAGSDAGAKPDAGPDAGADAGTDAGPSVPWDGGLWVDAGPFPAVTCIESSPLSSQNWTLDTTPLSLPQDEGRLLACYHTNSYNQLSAQALAAPYLLDGIVASTGFDEYIIQYASQGPPGTIRHVTALVYLPNGGQTSAPLVSIGHATSGMGPLCGVTHITSYADYLALPLVVQGMAVVATDYPGMGVPDGVSPYAVGWAEGMSILDAARATTQIHDSPRFDASQLSRQLLLFGHSQGGQSTLFAHQIYAQQNGPSLGLDLFGSVSFAPAYGDLRGVGDLVADAGTADEQDQFFLSMTMLAQSAYFGGPPLDQVFSSSAVTALPAVLETECTVTAMPGVEMEWPTVGDLFSPTFMADFSACDFDGGPCPSLAPWDTNLYAAVPGEFSSPVPALILQGEADTQVYPETTACITARLETEGTPVQTCAFAGATHITVVTEGMGSALTWISGRLSGTTPGVCDAGLIETCNP
jgi:Secretory lipase